MDKWKKILPWLCGAGFLFWVLVSVWDMGLYKMPPASGEREEELITMEILQNEEGTFSYFGEGDPGLSEEEMHSPVREAVPRTRSEMIRRVFHSIRVIPFSNGGRYWKSEYPVFTDGAGCRAGEYGAGVDSLGYVLWIYNAIFQMEIPHPAQEYRKGNQVLREELMAGDIGMTEYREGEPNHFGIFLGYDGGIPVFAHCSSRPYPGFPHGTVQLCTLSGEGLDFYGGEPAEAFQYFTRPDVYWEETGQNEDDILAGYLVDRVEKNKDVRRYAAFGQYLYGLIVEGDADGLMQRLNQQAASGRGYQVDPELFGRRMEMLGDICREKEIWLYDYMELPEKNAMVTRFCLSDMMAMEDTGEEVADTVHCTWLDFTFYMDDGGDIESFLPFPESIHGQAGQYGFTKIK